MDAKLLFPGYLQALCRALSESSLNRPLKWKIPPHGAFCSAGVSAGWRWRLCRPRPPANGSPSWALCQLPAWLSAELPVPENPLAMCQQRWKAENCPVGFQSCFFRFGNLKMHWSNMTISSQWRSVFCTLKQRSPTFLAPGASFVEDNFSMNWGQGEEMVSGWFMCITFIMHFICVITTLAPPQIIRR